MPYSPAISVLFYAAAVTLLVVLRPTLPIDETRYLSVAWEMRQAGSWLVPLLNGEPYGDKPPLLFWLIQSIWSIVGTQTLPVRLIAPACSAASVYLTALLAHEWWREDSGTKSLSAWIVATSGAFVLFGSMTMFDGLLTLFVLLALLGVVKAFHGAGAKAWLLVGLSLGLGVLAKGPVILIHVLPVALMMPLWAKGRQNSPLWHWYASVVLAVLVALAVVAAWLFPVYVGGNNAYLYEILWHQSAGRVADSFAHSHSPWFYLVVLPLFLWPWAWLGSRGESLFKARHLSDPGLRFCLVWFISALVIFSMIDGKQPQYLLPELPAFALAAARVLATTPGQPADPSRLRRILVSLPPIAAVGWLIVALLVGNVSSASASELLPMIAMGVAVLLLSLGLLLRRGVSSSLLAWGAVGLGAVLALHIVASPALFADYDGEAVAGSLAKFDGRGIAAYRSLENGELTFAGRLEHPVTLIESEALLRDWIVQHPCGAVVDRDAAMPKIAGLRRPETGFSFRRHAHRVFPVEGSGCLSPETTDASGIASADRRIFLPGASYL